MAVRHENVARLAIHAHHPDGSGPRRAGDAGQERLVAAAVEHRPRVVAEAAVDGDIGADARKGLDRADRVERDGRGGHDRPSGFDAESGRHAGVGRRLQHGAPPFGDRRCLLAGNIGHAEAAAD